MTAGRGGGETGGKEPGAHQIGLIPCLAFSVGTMIGGGVFTLSGIAVDKAGPAALLAYAIAGAVMLLSALSFVVVASRAEPPESGYGAISHILGARWRFLTMWAFYLNAVTILGFLMLSFGDYLNQYFLSAVSPQTAGLIAIGALALLNLGPATLVGKAETYLVALKVGILLLFVAYGLRYIDGADFTPFSPHGPSSVLSTSALLFTAYTGFNVVTNIASSVRNPQKTVPLAIILSILISATVYMGVIVALLASGVTNLGDSGLGKAADALMGHWGEVLIAFAACISTLSGANANVLGASEMTLRLAAQRDVPTVAGRLTPGGHPAVSVLFACGVGAILIGAGGINTIVEISNVTAIAAMLIVNVAAFQLARKQWPTPGARLPFGVAIPSVAFVTAAGQLVSIPWQSVLVGTALVLAGLLIHTQRRRAAMAHELERILHDIARLETPVARSLRRSAREEG